MAQFDGIGIFDHVNKRWEITFKKENLDTVMETMKILELNAIQLDFDQDRFLFFDSGGDRYGACLLYTSRCV